jgi:hypothetical protein
MCRELSTLVLLVVFVLGFGITIKIETEVAKYVAPKLYQKILQGDHESFTLLTGISIVVMGLVLWLMGCV